ncbi:MAG: DUF2851 family protein [Tidjanibacter sp.]|nr:DUF2851 family protein [Tidjanibacter sp.]
MSRMCGAELATMEPLHRTRVMESLLVGRFLRKCGRVREVWESAERDWNQTLYTMTAYAMGAPRNSAPFEELSRRATYLMCLRERASLRRVEALLLGTSGLMHGEFYNDRVVGLQEEFDYLANKYGVRAMNASSWNRRSSYPAGNPIVRVAQMAALITKDDYSVDALLEAKSLADVERMFDITTTSQWLSVEDGTKQSLRLGKEKIHTLAINLVAPMQFAYGEVMRNEELKERALALLEEIPTEHNRLVARWTGEGVPSVNACDSQALIELSHLCDEGRCAECPLGRLLARKK